MTSEWPAACASAGAALGSPRRWRSPSCRCAPVAGGPAAVPLTPEQRFALALEAQTEEALIGAMSRRLRTSAEAGFRPAQEMLGMALLGGPALFGNSGAASALRSAGLVHPRRRPGQRDRAGASQPAEPAAAGPALQRRRTQLAPGRPPVPDLEIVAPAAVHALQQPQRPLREVRPRRRSCRRPAAGRARTPRSTACSAARRRCGACSRCWPRRRGSCRRRAATSGPGSSSRSTASASSKLPAAMRWFERQVGAVLVQVRVQHARRGASAG